MSSPKLLIFFAIPWLCGFSLLGPSQREDEPRVFGFAIHEIEDSSARDSDPELARWAFDAWSRVSGNRLQFKEVAWEEARIRIDFNSRRAGLFGEMVPFRAGKFPGAQVFIMADVSKLGENIRNQAAEDELYRETVVYLTCLHEIGHALELDHTADFNDIMYSFGYGGDISEFFERYRRRLTQRSDIRNTDGTSESDRARLLEVLSNGGPLDESR